MVSSKVKKIMLVAGEVSGDVMGAVLVRDLKEKYPDAEIFGVVGQNMKEAGCEEVGNISQLSVMGLVEVLKHLPRILKFKKKLVKIGLARKPDLFIGIDAPDFNLRLAHSFKAVGIKTIQYVSPTVWAWRQKRVYGIKKVVDHVCCLFPFEVDFYKKYGQDATFVGHPAALEFPSLFVKKKYKQQLGLLYDNNKKIKTIALLPGSRVSEVTRMLPIFLQVAKKLVQSGNNLEFVVPCAHPSIKPLIEQIIARNIKNNEIVFKVIQDKSKQVLLASDLALITSGTATLEAMMAKVPMIVAYKMPYVTYLIGKKLVKTLFISLPNILANVQIVPEFIQAEVKVSKLAEQMQLQLDLIASGEIENTIRIFDKIHRSLKVSPEVFLGVVDKMLK